MDEAHGWSLNIEMNGDERQIALEVGGHMLWLEVDGARRLAGGSCPVKWWRFRSAILAPHAI
jgi:hypothetical protein